ncbi:hypothetical protein CERSUDRAFT_47511, partial [Gelatoporia subvermispora B]
FRGHDYPEALPLPYGELPLVQMTVEESVHYHLLGVGSHIEWYSYASANEGFVRLGKEDRLFTITMFHELHCLSMLSCAFRNTSRPTPQHIKHCLNYIRQGVLCATDLTLEPGDFETKDYQIERTGATFTCKDWNIVYSVMDEIYTRWENKARTRHY